MGSDSRLSDYGQPKPKRSFRMNDQFRDTLDPAEMTAVVKDIGCRQAYDILQSRKPRATSADLWGFRFSPRYWVACSVDAVQDLGLRWSLE